METFIKKAEDLETVNNNFMPPLLDAILGDYNRNVPAARDAEVLNVMATIIGRLGVRSLYERSIIQTDHACFFVLASVDPSSAGYSGRGIRADVEYDQPRLLRVP